MNIRHLRAFVAAAAIAGSASCAYFSSGGGSWENAAVPREEWPRDQAACQSAAREQAEREFRPTATGLSPAASNPNPTGGQWSGMMDQYSAERRQSELFERCMTQRGYRLVPSGA